ncbi:hypothetical protein CH63R_07535 [Colletotrichum higginsianum IMI 349063]|uniref:Uncharacterized protein n=1 Tax=Colletotrichum higginsianum (strain IMI 349063) TaxID=759273 RepID=A0A1B7YA14_COLHI|nr:hypothetical protein CH63R_07535 [Colletotrichum higginsianum IMI 349063]OBR08770.1 hypothetical protein CH63R_07535 [Colletotrichum higginsianum IMI 349063]GJC97166.1 hypothetical protein ColKHC_05992 [Colletotrichum higginsianum]
MPSLSLLRRGTKHDQQRPISPQKQQQQRHQLSQLSPRHEDGMEAGPQEQQPGSSGTGGAGERERERKFSKRDLFGGLLNRSKGRGSSSSSASTPASSTKSGRGTGAESPTKFPARSLKWAHRSNAWALVSLQLHPDAPMSQCSQLKMRESSE